MAIRTAPRWKPKDAPKRPREVVKRLRSRDLKVKQGAFLMGKFQQNIRTAGHGAWPKKKAKFGPQRTGYVSGQMFKMMVLRISGDELAVIDRAPHSVVFHFGHKGITPVLKKYLTVPLTAFASRRSARQIPGLFCVKPKTGGLYLARKKANGDLEFLYKLVKKVKVPERPFFTLRPSDEREFERRTAEFGMTGRF